MYPAGTFVGHEPLRNPELVYEVLHQRYAVRPMAGSLASAGICSYTLQNPRPENGRVPGSRVVVIQGVRPRPPDLHMGVYDLTE
jgi:hypothetical protein